MRLSGTESISIELAGSLASPLQMNVPAPLVLTSEVSILVLTMKRLGIDRAPLLPRFDYNEVLYRVGGAIDGESAWLALRCDLDRLAIRRMAEATIRYPVARAEIAITDARTTLRIRATGGDGVFAASLTIDETVEMPAATRPRRTFVLSRERLFEIPWDERPAPERRLALVEVSDTSAARALFGDGLTLAKEALVHRGRTHFCGAAKQFVPASG